MDSSLVALDVHPGHLQAMIKGKVFQLRFLEEVFSDKARAERSQNTGHLVVTMPKVKPDFSAVPMVHPKQPEPERRAVLEVQNADDMDFSKISQQVNDPKSCNFDDLPPLEEVES